MRKKAIIIGLLIFMMCILPCCKTEDPFESDSSDNIDNEQYDDEGINPADGDIGSGLAMLKEEPTEDNEHVFFLLRDGENYTLGASCSNEYALNGTRTLYDNNGPLNGKWGFTSVGYVPEVVLEPDDLIVSYSKSDVPELGLKKASFYGYAIPVRCSEDGGSLYYYVDYPSDTTVDKPGVSNVTVTDLSGNTVDDMYNLNELEGYNLGWYEGTQYDEAYLVADCKAYIFDSDGYDDDYKIEGKLTKNGYAEYDLSGIPAGTYRVGGNAQGGVITISQ